MQIPDRSPESKLSSVRVMTWNMHGARTMFGRPDLSRVIEQVRKHSPDIVALQEVDARRCGNNLAFDTLASSLGEYRPPPTISR